MISEKFGPFCDKIKTKESLGAFRKATRKCRRVHRLSKGIQGKYTIYVNIVGCRLPLLPSMATWQIDITIYTEMDMAFTEIKLRQSLHNSVQDWEESYYRWIHVDFNTLVVTELVDLTTKTIKNCMQYEKYLPPNNMVPELKQSAEDFKLKLPVIGYLRNPNFRAVRILKSH